jgi:hypothetical protein
VHIDLVVNMELVPKKLSSLTGVWFQFWIMIGIYIGWFVRMIHVSLFKDPDDEPGYMWHYFIYLWPLVIHIPRLCGVLWLFTFDTPQFYMKKHGMNTKCFETNEAVLKKFYHEKDVPKIHFYLMKEFLLTN